MKKAIFLMIGLLANLSFAATFPSCPDANTVSTDLYNLQSVTDSTLPNGWHLYYGNVQTTPDYNSQYNYYAATPPVGKTPLDQIHYLSIMLHVPVMTDYEANNTDYRQCVYYGSMDANGNPQGTQVVSLQYSHALPPVPPAALTLTLEGSDLPLETHQNQIYTVQYQLSNTNGVNIAYTISPQTLPTGVSVAASTTCNVQNQQTELNANSACTIAYQFDPNQVAEGTHYDHLPLFNLSAASGVTPDSILINTTVVHFSIHNIIMFGDSLSDIGNVGIFTNDPNPSIVNRVWFQVLTHDETEVEDDHQSVNSKTYRATGVSPNDANVDYAYGGACAQNGSCYAPILPRYPSLYDQVHNYEQDLQKTNSTISPNTLFLLWAGGNDIIGTRSVTPAGFKQQAQLTAQAVMDNINELVNVDHVNPHNIVVLNLPDIGTIPLFNSLPIASLYTTASEEFNADLKASLEAQFPNTESGPKLMDIFTFLTNTMHNPASGFTNITQACTVASSDKNNCPGFAFDDPIHPTVKAHADIAHYIEANL